MNSKRCTSLIHACMSITLIILLAFPMQVFANTTATNPISSIRNLDPLGIHIPRNQAEYSPRFSFYGKFEYFNSSWFKPPVKMGSCQSYNAECTIDNSGKPCCAGLYCDPFNDNSGNGKCKYSPCTNGATNPPACDTCPAGKVLYNGQCVSVCSDPLANNQGQPLPCTYDPCQNGATNPPTCTNCPAGQVLSNGQCVAACTDPQANNQGQPLPCTYNPCANGATNPPTCSDCPAGQVMSNGTCVAACTDPQANNQGQPLPCTYNPCANGATNPPTCSDCPAGQVMSNGTCVAACTDPQANNQGQPLPCTYNPCANGATNPPTCNECPANKVLSNGQCVDACMDESANNAGLPLPCTYDPCQNGATNPPTCSDCPAGQVLSNGTCVAACTDPQANNQGQPLPCSYNPCANGATNPPTCDQCPAGQVMSNGTCVAACTDDSANNYGQPAPCTYDPCQNGATNPPACTDCPAGQVMSNGVCVAACTDDSANNYGQPAPCTYDPCTNGATNPPACNECPEGKVLVNGQCVGLCNDRTANNFGQPLPCTFAPIKITPTLIIPVTGSHDVIAAGIGHTCAVTTQLGLSCWGDNDYGQLGNGTFKRSGVPVIVKGIESKTVTALVAGSKHTCALLSTGDVMCWGLNFSGQLGDGTNISRNLPVKVTGLKGNIVSITAGLLYTCAVNDQNETMCWGENGMGQLANGNTDNSNVPVLSTLTGIKSISGAYNELQAITSAGGLAFFTKLPVIPVTGLASDVALLSGDRFNEGGCALNTAGNVECWGSIKGTGISGAQMTNLLSSGQYHACVQTDKGLVCWGDNTFGQLGDGSQTSSESPMLVKGIQNVIALAAGSEHTCAIVDPKTIMCWGNNEFGQLGNGATKNSSVPVKVK